MRRGLLALAGMAGLSVASAALAHHSFAMFDTSREMVLQGTVKQFQWTNPHSWIQLMVPDEKGVAQEWSIEAGGPNGLARQGWTLSSFKPGDAVALRVNPLRNGKLGGSFIGATFPGGRTLGRTAPRTTN